MATTGKRKRVETDKKGTTVGRRKLKDPAAVRKRNREAVGRTKLLELIEKYEEFQGEIEKLHKAGLHDFFLDLECEGFCGDKCFYQCSWCYDDGWAIENTVPDNDNGRICFACLDKSDRIASRPREKTKSKRVKPSEVRKAARNAASKDDLVKVFENIEKYQRGGDLHSTGAHRFYLSDDCYGSGKDVCTSKCDWCTTEDCPIEWMEAVKEEYPTKSGMEVLDELICDDCIDKAKAMSERWKGVHKMLKE